MSKVAQAVRVKTLFKEVMGLSRWTEARFPD